MRLKKKENQTRPESLEGETKRGWWGWLNLRQRDKEVFEPVTQHYSVTTRWTQSLTQLMNTAGPAAQHKASVGEFH